MRLCCVLLGILLYWAQLMFFVGAVADDDYHESWSHHNHPAEPNVYTDELIVLQPPVPHDIKAQALSTSSAVVYWKAIANLSDIVGYKVRYSSEAVSVDKWREVEVRPASVDHVIVDNLHSNEIYAFKIATIWGKGSISRFSELVTVKVDPINVVSELGAREVTKNQVSLNWDFSRLPAQFKVTYRGYKLYRTHDKHWKEVHVGPFSEVTNQRAYVFSTLRPNTIYSFSVSVIQGGNEYWPVSINVTTLKEIPPFVVEPLVGDARTSNGAQITLQPASEEYGEINEYWLVVVPKQIEKVPHDISNKELIPNVGDSQTPSGNMPWVAARFTSQELIEKGSIMLGDRAKRGDFANHPLNKDTDYRVFLRAFIGDPGADINYASSSYSQEFRVWSGNSSRTVREGGLFLILGPVVAFVVIGIIVGGIVIFLIQRQKKKTMGKTGHTTKTTLSSEEATNLLLSDSYANGNGNYGQAQMYTASAPNGHIQKCQSYEANNYNPVELRRLDRTQSSHGVSIRPPVSVTELAEHIERLKGDDNRLFSDEFESIDTGSMFTWENSLLPVNSSKNRYANVICYDHSRVVLNSVPGVPGSDYINANYIDSYRPDTYKYIATQGPLPETFGDFWRMIWQENSAIIVMLTRLEERTRVKCDQYWPNRGTQQYGPVLVTIKEVLELAHYTIRTFLIQQGHEVREIRQLQFTAWPDHGVPDHPTPFLMFLKRVKNSQPPEVGPIVVHCSAGVGRTGAFIVIDHQLERLRYETSVDIPGAVATLRCQRQYMVQTEDQYVFIYEAVLDAVNSGYTEVQVSRLFSHVQKLKQFSPVDKDCVTGMEQEFRSLSTIKLLNTKCSVGNLPCNKPKNRLVNILPYDSSRVCLCPSVVEGSDYINACFIDSYRRRASYIATQAPMDNTCDDFWRMLFENSSTIVVMLTKLVELGRDKCYQYWPADDRSHRYGYFVVEPIAEYNMPQYILREFKLTDSRTGESRTIRHFQYTEWPEQGVPKSGENFIEFIGQVHKTKDQFGQDGPITVHCSAGVGRTGVFIALSVILERMRLECVVDVFTTVKLLRTQRPSMVQSEEQYEFCYQAALEYLNSFDHYAMQL